MLTNDDKVLEKGIERCQTSADDLLVDVVRVSAFVWL